MVLASTWTELRRHALQLPPRLTRVESGRRKGMRGFQRSLTGIVVMTNDVTGIVVGVTSFEPRVVFGDRIRMEGRRRTGDTIVHHVIPGRPETDTVCSRTTTRLTVLVWTGVGHPMSSVALTDSFGERAPEKQTRMKGTAPRAPSIRSQDSRLILPIFRR